MVSELNNIIEDCFWIIVLTKQLSSFIKERQCAQRQSLKNTLSFLKEPSLLFFRHEAMVDKSTIRVMRAIIDFLTKNKINMREHEGWPLGYNSSRL